MDCTYFGSGSRGNVTWTIAGARIAQYDERRTSSHGMITGLGHGIGFGLYAFMTSAALSIALAAHRSIEALLRWSGASLLLWLGYTFIRHAVSGQASGVHFSQSELSVRAGFMQGFFGTL